MGDQSPEIIVEKRTPDRLPLLSSDRGYLCAVPIIVFPFFLPLLGGHNRLRLAIYIYFKNMIKENSLIEEDGLPVYAIIGSTLHVYNTNDMYHVPSEKKNGVFGR